MQITQIGGLVSIHIKSGRHKQVQGYFECYNNKRGAHIGNKCCKEFRVHNLAIAVSSNHLVSEMLSFFLSK